MIKILENKISINNIIIGEPVLIFTRAYTNPYNNKFVKIEYSIVLEKEYVKLKKFLKELELREKILGETTFYQDKYFIDDIILKKDYIIKNITSKTELKDILSNWQTQNQEILIYLKEKYNIVDNDYIVIDNYDIDYSEIEEKINEILEQRQQEEKMVNDVIEINSDGNLENIENIESN